MNRITTTAVAGAFALSAAALWAQDPRPNSAPQPSSAAQSKMSATTSTASHELSSFAKKAAIGGMAEVELGRLAAEKGSNDRVKQFGQRMVDDHSKANDELKQAASAAGIELPSEIDGKSKATIEKLSKLSGAAFDKAYMADMVEDHEHDVAEFTKAAKSPDSPVGSFAGKTLPTLREHLKMAKDVDQEVAGAKAKK
jgi:putative membrane protein